MVTIDDLFRNDTVDYMDQIDTSEIYHPNQVYPEEIKIAYIANYIATGTMREASRLTGIPEDIAKNWKSQSSWWEPTVAKVRKQKQDELDAVLTSIVHETTDHIKDRIKYGDYKRTRDGTYERIPISGKDLAVILGVLFDKRALIRGDFTSISARSNADMKSLEQKFTKIAQDLQGKTIEGTVIKEDETSSN